jgi:Tfp pilus assembly pilus retraction ATPase PilT
MAYQEAINIEGILSFAIRKGASDVHICEEDHVAFRIHGHLGKLTQAGVMTKDVMQRLALEMFHDDTHRLEEFHQKKDIDFAYLSTDGTSFRVNGFFKL